jgi:hypothetical protein
VEMKGGAINVQERCNGGDCVEMLIVCGRLVPEQSTPADCFNRIPA